MGQEHAMHQGARTQGVPKIHRYTYLYPSEFASSLLNKSIFLI